MFIVKKKLIAFLLLFATSVTCLDAQIVTIRSRHLSMSQLLGEASRQTGVPIRATFRIPIEKKIYYDCSVSLDNVLTAAKNNYSDLFNKEVIILKAKGGYVLTFKTEPPPPPAVKPEPEPMPEPEPPAPPEPEPAKEKKQLKGFEIEDGEQFMRLPKHAPPPKKEPAFPDIHAVGEPQKVERKEPPPVKTEAPEPVEQPIVEPEPLEEPEPFSPAPTPKPEMKMAPKATPKRETTKMSPPPPTEPKQEKKAKDLEPLSSPSPTQEEVKETSAKLPPMEIQMEEPEDNGVKTIPAPPNEEKKVKKSVLSLIKSFFVGNRKEKQKAEPVKSKDTNEAGEKTETPADSGTKGSEPAQGADSQKIGPSSMMELEVLPPTENQNNKDNDSVSNDLGTDMKLPDTAERVEMLENEKTEQQQSVGTRRNPKPGVRSVIYPKGREPRKGGIVETELVPGNEESGGKASAVKDKPELRPLDDLEPVGSGTGRSVPPLKDPTDMEPIELESVDSNLAPIDDLEELPPLKIRSKNRPRLHSY